MDVYKHPEQLGLSTTSDLIQHRSTYEVELEELSKTYRRGKTVALTDVSVKLEAGKVTGLLGPNGSGKTTLARILVGLLKPSSGVVSIAGTILTAQKRSSIPVGYVPQRLPGFPGMTANDLIEFVLVAQGYWGLNVRTARNEVVERLGIQAIQHKRIWYMSGGEARLTLIASAIAAKPKLIVFDEPNTGLDADNRKKFWNILASIKSDWSPTILLITHDIDDAEHVIDNAVVLRQGRLIAHGDVVTLRNDYANFLKCRVVKNSPPEGEGWQAAGPGQWKKIISRDESGTMLALLDNELKQGAAETSLSAASLEDVVLGKVHQ